MQTNYLEQMDAVKKELHDHEIELRRQGVINYTSSRHWLALNDAYSTIAAVRLQELKSNPG